MIFAFRLTEAYFQNNLNFHGLRAQCTKEFYFEQLRRIKDDPNYAKQLEREIYARWEKMNLKKDGNPKNFRKNEWYGVYILRGKNRNLAIKKGLPISYDKRALLATSIGEMMLRLPRICWHKAFYFNVNSGTFHFVTSLCTVDLLMPNFMAAFRTVSLLSAIYSPSRTARSHAFPFNKIPPFHWLLLLLATLSLQISMHRA